MKRLLKIEQLKKGMQFHVIKGDNVLSYAYLCIHPHNSNYILAIESISQNAIKLYIKTLTDVEEVYIGNYDMKFFINKKIEIYEERLKSLRLVAESLK